MDLLQLQYFRTVAYLEHMTKAAELLHVSQPSLSRTISNLEKELGVELFLRSGRAITLNQYGRMLLGHVNRALDELDDARRELGDSLALAGASIIISSSLSGFVTNPMDDFSTLHPEVHMSCRINSCSEMEELLEAREIDFGIAERTIYESASDWTPLSTESFYVLYPKGHELERLAAPSFSELVGYKLALPETGSSTRNILSSIMLNQGAFAHPTFEITDVYAQLQLIKRGNTISFIPSSALYDILENREASGYSQISGLGARIISGTEKSWRLEISPLSGRSGNPLVSEFRSYCIEYFNRRQQQMDSAIAAFCAGKG